MKIFIPEVFPVAQSILMLGFLVFLRVGVAIAVLPAFGERSVPQRVRLALSICLTLIVAPIVSERVFPTINNITFVGQAVATEVVTGLVIGIVIRLLVMVLEIAGSIIAQSTSLSQMFGGGAIDAQPVVGHILLLGGLALAAMMDLHLRIVELLVASYDFIPLGAFIAAGDLSQWGLSHISSAFSLAFSLAAPFVMASLVYNIALGVINRAMPQLMVAMVGAPAITLGGMILMLIALPLLLQIWRTEFITLLANPFEVR